MVSSKKNLAVTASLSVILVIALAGVAFAQVGIIDNPIVVKIDNLNVDQSYLPYGATATLNATLNNTSPSLSGTIDLEVFPPGCLQDMVNISGEGLVFFGVGQTRNVILTIQNVGTLSTNVNSTFYLQVLTPNLALVDSAGFELSLGANPNFQTTSEPTTQANSTIEVTCLDNSTNSTIAGINVELFAPENSMITSNTTNTNGSCILNLGSFPAASNSNVTARASDAMGRYFSVNQSISISTGGTSIVMYMKKSSSDVEVSVELLTAIVAVLSITCILIVVVRRRRHEPSPQTDCNPTEV